MSSKEEALVAGAHLAQLARVDPRLGGERLPQEGLEPPPLHVCPRRPRAPRRFHARAQAGEVVRHDGLYAACDPCEEERARRVTVDGVSDRRAAAPRELAKYCAIV